MKISVEAYELNESRRNKNKISFHVETEKGERAETKLQKCMSWMTNPNNDFGSSIASVRCLFILCGKGLVVDYVKHIADGLS